ncbi:MAG: chromosomal replication initiator protein DnaA [Gammaproteobacteria bacterium]|nr:chromosomal replication initiator protein DnaA [Gammaproteobacteria bacterium]
MSLWQQCITELESLLPEEDVNTWIRSLEAVETEHCLRLVAPNASTREWIRKNCLGHISRILSLKQDTVDVQLEAGPQETPSDVQETAPEQRHRALAQAAEPRIESCLNPEQTFETFIEGKSNRLACAAAQQVASNPSRSFNPLLFYSGVGLGKTHLVHAIGNEIKRTNDNLRVLYLTSERFVADMVRALRKGKMDSFTRFYRSLNVLLVDDIQFFADKEQSQEEFFHTFNTLFQSQSQIIMTCDCYPAEVEGLQERLKSRFGWGLTQAIEPPELETRVAILQSKARHDGVTLPDEVAHYIAENIRSNIRELEGALRRVIANASFTAKEITIEFARDALRDLIATHNRILTIEKIQKTAADYYSIRPNEMVSPRRNRTVVRPRQMAMALAKDLTNHSLPEIGEAFGGRDHTTVIHACRKIRDLRQENTQVEQEYKDLTRILNG